MVVELKIEEDGFMFISLRIGLLCVTLILIHLLCVCVVGGHFLGARDGV